MVGLRAAGLMVGVRAPGLMVGLRPTSPAGSLAVAPPGATWHEPRMNSSVGNLLRGRPAADSSERRGRAQLPCLVARRTRTLGAIAVRTRRSDNSWIASRWKLVRSRAR